MYSTQAVRVLPIEVLGFHELSVTAKPGAKRSNEGNSTISRIESLAGDPTGPRATVTWVRCESQIV